MISPNPSNLSSLYSAEKPDLLKSSLANQTIHSSLDSVLAYISDDALREIDKQSKKGLETAVLLETGARLVKGINTICWLMVNNTDRLNGMDDESPLHAETLLSLAQLAKGASDLYIKQIEDLNKKLEKSV